MKDVHAFLLFVGTFVFLSVVPFPWEPVAPAIEEAPEVAPDDVDGGTDEEPEPHWAPDEDEYAWWEEVEV
jgi:hypothetical protein